MASSERADAPPPRRRKSSFYERRVLPHLLHCACGSGPVSRARAAFVPEAAGIVAELGFGSGRNLAFYDPRKVSRLIAIEPERGMIDKAAPAIAAASFPIEVHETVAEALDLAPASLDCLVSTFTLCTIPDPVSALSALRAALKPGGRLMFLEHGLAPEPSVARLQKRIEPLWRPIAGGCHLTRKIGPLIEAAGYEIDRVERFYLPRAPRFSSYVTRGIAHPRA